MGMRMRFDHIDRDRPEPVAHQLAALIREQIERGDLQPGDRLPTEHELCQQLGISRTPVRRALRRLTEQGLLARYPGRGTFVSASAGTSSPSQPEDLTITLTEDRWCWPWQQAAALWNAEHPHQPVRIHFRIVDYRQLRGHLALAVAQGEVSDIALIDSVWIAEFADRGYLHPLHAIDHHLAEEITNDVIPPIRPLHHFDGILYAVPADSDFCLLWYRKDWFHQEGLAPPQTWDEWLQCARHFQSPLVRQRYGLSPYPLLFVASPKAGETATYQLLPILWSAGANVIASGKVVLNSHAARRAVAFVADLVTRHRVASPEVISLPWNGPALAFASGSAAMAIGGSYERSLIKSAAGWDDEEFTLRAGFVPIPAGPDGAPATLLGGLSYAIFRQSRRPQLALELLARVSRPDVMSEFCLRTGQNPPTRSAAQILHHETSPFHKATSQLAAFARARWPLVEYDRVSVQIARMFASAITGELQPDEAVARAAAVIAGITGLPELGSRRSA
jgi:multiple sugar transport system substrate-binding protein